MRMTRPTPPTRRTTALAGIAGLALVATACSTGGGEPTAQDTADGDAPTEVVVVTHGSWNVPDEVMEAFTEQTGFTARVEPAGDAGELTNKLVLTKNSPLGDVVFGIDNTFASRAVEEGVIAEHSPEELPEGAEEYALEDGDAAARLTPIDHGDVCVNIDDTWFADNDVEPPATLADLVDPAYEGLFVTPGATTSSPGLAFLLATIAEHGEDGWEEYWAELMANGTKLTSGWTDAYTVDFTAGGGDGDRPIVLSYASSPPFTIPEGGDEPTTSALLDTCFRQVEYAGVLEGAENPEGAAAFVDFMVGEEFQAALPENMYVFPVSDEVELPEAWAAHAEVADDPYEVDPAAIAENRDEWLRTWGDVTTR